MFGTLRITLETSGDVHRATDGEFECHTVVHRKGGREFYTPVDRRTRSLRDVEVMCLEAARANGASRVRLDCPSGFYSRGELDLMESKVGRALHKDYY